MLSRDTFKGINDNQITRLKIGKKIEILVRDLVNKLLIKGSNTKVINSDEICDDFKNIKKALFLRHDRIGDVLVSIPFFKNFREHFPKVEIDVLLSDKNSGTSKVLRNYSNKIHILPKDLIRIYYLIKELNRSKYDIIIDMFDTVSTRSNLLLQFIKSNYKLGFEKPNKSLYTHIIPMPDKSQIHIVERVLNLLTPFGKSYDKTQIRLEYPLEEKITEKAYLLLGEKVKEYRLGIILSGSSTAKFWGIHNISQFIRLFNKKFFNFEIIVFGTEKHSKMINELPKVDCLKVAPYTNSLDEYAAMLSHCDYLITPDTSAVHFASAFSIPCLVMYSIPVNSGFLPWYPYNSKYTAVITNELSIQFICAEEVLEKFFELYESTGK